MKLVHCTEKQQYMFRLRICEATNHIYIGIFYVTLTFHKCKLICSQLMNMNTCCHRITRMSNKTTSLKMCNNVDVFTTYKFQEVLGLLNAREIQNTKFNDSVQKIPNHLLKKHISVYQ